MPSTYSPLKIELIATGEQSGTWGTTTNTNLGTAIEEAITGSADVTFVNGSDTTVTLTDVNTTQAARNLRLNLVGSANAAQNLILGSGCQIEKLYLINNTLTQTITVKNTTGTGIAVPAGKTMFVYNNGTNVVDAITYLSSLTTTQVNITGQGDLRLEDTSGGEYVALQAPGTLASSYTLTMPVDDGTNGQALITDGSGNLSWSTAASGDVYGPASATDNAITRFDGTTGKLIQNSSALVDDAGNVLAGAGLVGAPAFSTTGDTNTGIFFPAADTIAFTEGGVEAMRIDSSANIGIGTTSPSVSGIEISRATGTASPTPAELRLSTTGNASDWSTTLPWGRISFYSADASGGGPKIQATIDTIAAVGNGNYASIVFSSTANSSSLVERMRIEPINGDVGINTTTPGANSLTVQGKSVLVRNDTDYLKFNNAADTTYWGRISQNSSDIEFSNRQVGALKFLTADTERMRITSNGNVGIASTLTNTNNRALIRLDSVNNITNVLMLNNGTSDNQAGTGVSLNMSGVSEANANLRYAYIQAATASTGNDHYLSFGTNASAATPTEKMRITSAGDVGIGTTSPAAKLEVRDGVNTTFTNNPVNLSLSNNGTIAAGLGAGIAFSANFNGSILTTYAAISGIRENATSGSPLGALVLGTRRASGAAMEAMRIDSSGNVGIGTSSPAAISSYRSLTIQGGNTSNGGLIQLQNSDSSCQAYWFTTSNLSELKTITNHPLALGTNNTERMRIDTSGNLGLGVTPSAWASYKPFQILDSAVAAISNNQIVVVQNGFYDGAWKYQNTNLASFYQQYQGQHRWHTAASGTAGNAITFTQAMTLDASGRLGIGTTSPSSPLSVVGAGGVATVRYTGRSSDNSSTVDFYSNDNATRYGFQYYDSTIAQYYTSASIPMAFGTAGTERMRIDSSGNVLVGTTTMGGRITSVAASGQQQAGYFAAATGQFILALNTAGGSNMYLATASSADESLRFINSGGGEIVRIAAGGNVGIGTSSPATKLHVAGSGPTVRIDGTGAGNSGAKLQILGWAAAEPNWQIDTASIASGLEFVPSTAVGGSTFTTPAFSMKSSGIFTVASGIQFPATQVASGDANTLDDYEEGTWTPTVFGGTTAGTTTYGSQNGYYTKIGRQVTAIFDVNYTAATGTGNIFIGGFPFTATGLTGSSGVGSIMSSNFNWAGGTSLSVYTETNSTRAAIYGSADDAALTQQTISNEAANFWGTVTYFV